MQRRDAIKNIGLSLGFVAATPTLLSILQSCTGDPKVEWTPEFFTPEEGSILSKMVDIILPKTEDLPGAAELNVPQFIDKYIKEVYSPEDQKRVKNGMKAFTDKLGVSAQDLPKVKEEEIEKVIASSLKINADQRKDMERKLREYKDSDDGASPENEDVLVFGFVKDIREKTIAGFKISEYIGEEVLAYDPIPGKQQGCISLEEATGGKLWSL
ncbi:gluconate 2-dehydrogenase subunit 3 family protein [Sinomicrobium pectinilyticum]|uniref:Gluconate 2-dehydrogenase subunit 3 family protein n=1 Tax=Sinomicrobium pectinilyticum TaxID=1084421 RepID=A0A3N0EYR8_SINP1|nr:gluconate 2-dehydrogenase subunit 3 family protein [Sinomicrobium pectinilyticum]RNL93006.1 gluconate 2-dehydrogenase subunit 3 family protein [Sinomicrobium pectinilyticum]